MSPSARALWQAYRRLHPDCPPEPYESFHFCDNREDANLCADLVTRGIKRATAASVAELEKSGMRHPVPGDLSVVTTWEGDAVAIIRTLHVDIRRFDDVDEDFAQREGEGDKSLSFWREVHRAYYQRALAGTSTPVDGDLLIVCEDFQRVF